MKIEAAVVREPGGPFLRETLTLAEPREDEVLVRIISTGLCHSDIISIGGEWPPGLPVVLGHEGAGVVVRIGANVDHVAPGDHVVLSYNTCGKCEACLDGRMAYCENFYSHNLGGCRPDGSGTLQTTEGDHVHGCYFGQSSFANYVIANRRNTVKVRQDAPLELLGPLGCGVLTGAGAVLNVLKPRAGSSFAVFGCGGVGLSALMAAKLSGCDPIIAVDRVPARLEIARELGATVVIDADREDPVKIIGALGGALHVVEATGITTVIEQAIEATRNGGDCALLGVAKQGASITLEINRVFPGKSLRGVIEGDADPQVFIPFLVDKFMAGEFPLDKLTSFYTLDTINDAVADSTSGVAIKPIIRMPV